jgi:hypothetical protein
MPAVDEAALRRPLLGREQTHAQIDHLIEMDELPHVSLQVLPFSCGGHPAAGGPFSFCGSTTLSCPMLSTLNSSPAPQFLDKRADVEIYIAVMDRLSALIEPPARTAAILEAIRADI